MGIFSLFSRNSQAPCTDLVWLTPEAKLRGTLKYISENKPGLCIAWFDDTRDRFYRCLNEENNMNIDIKSGSFLQPYHLENKNVVFLEHYPLYTKEAALLSGSNAASISFMNSFDDPVLKIFGSNITDIMRRLGLEEDQAVESPLVSRAIINARKRIEKKVRNDFHARSGAEWLEKYRSEYGV